MRREESKVNKRESKCV